MQASLFDIENTSPKPKPKHSLIISTQKKQPLNKQQQAFNRLVKRIEKLRLELKETSASLDEKLNYYGKHIYPLEQQLVIARKEMVKLLFPFCTENKIAKSHKETLKQFLSIQLREIFAIDNNKPDAELQAIFEKINGVSYEDATNQEFEMVRDEMESMFEDIGFDMDFKDFDKNMSPEEMMAKMKGLEEEFLKQKEDLESKKASRKKTAKQLEKEERDRQLEEARNKNISSIYKQLAKALHPDLEQDENIKLEKEILMKRLTVAYDNNDLHSMLSLEMEWIHKEEQHTDKLSTEKLAIYNQVLREQLQDLQEQADALIDHPRFQPLLRYSGFLGFVPVNLPKEKKQLEETLSTMKNNVTNLKGKNAIKEAKNIIRAINDFNWDG